MSEVAAAPQASTSAPPAASTVEGAVAFCGEHPERASVATCLRCGTFACAECAHPTPDGQAFCAACRARGAGAIAWEQRKSVGRWKAFWRTTRAVMLTPKSFFRTPQYETGILAPFFYNTGVQAVAQLGTALTLMIVYGALGLVLAATLPPNRADEANVIIILAIVLPAAIGFFGVLNAPVNAIWNMAIGGGLAHLGLMVVRGKKAGFEATARALAYAQAPMALHVVPIVGILIAPFWTLVASVVALRETHECSTWRAFLGIILFPIFLALTVAAAVFVLVFAAPVLFRQ
ncbi:MAG: YIP1 family protein [Deltaproteobacteria bacterium]|nr:YIP1 family protein [Deltaproteobacteria bacterium]